MIKETKTSLIYWIHAIELVFSIVIAFSVSISLGVCVFVFGEVLIMLTQKEMTKRMEIVWDKSIQPAFDKMKNNQNLNQGDKK